MSPGTTAGHNYIALIEEARQESISLGALGYWELVPDPPSFLRNHDVQLVVRNRSPDRFKLGFAYDATSRNLRCSILEGAVRLSVKNDEYYPVLIVRGLSPAAPEDKDDQAPRRYLFFDFNSFDADLRIYYGSVKRLLTSSPFSLRFYCYEAANYNAYYFKIYDTVEALDTHKMGLSLENDTLSYYQKILDNLKSQQGTDFADQIVIVSRFGKKYIRQLQRYARDIGWPPETEVLFRSYEDIK